MPGRKQPILPARHLARNDPLPERAGIETGSRTSSGGLVAVQNLLHVVDVDGWPPARRLQGGEDLPGDRLLAVLVAAGITELDHGWVHAAQWDVRTTWPGDIVVVELVSANVDRYRTGPDIGVGPFFEPEGAVQRLLYQVHQLRILGLGAHEYECLP